MKNKEIWEHLSKELAKANTVLSLSRKILTSILFVRARYNLFTITILDSYTREIFLSVHNLFDKKLSWSLYSLEGLSDTENERILELETKCGKYIKVRHEEIGHSSRRVRLEKHKRLQWLPDEELEKEWIGNYELIPGTKEILDKLRKKYKVMYLSDNVKERVERLDERFGFISWFDGGIFSHEVGVRKPNPKIYEYALQKGEAKPEETIFIDDKPKMLEPAIEMGMIGLVFESSKKLEMELKRLGVL